MKATNENLEDEKWVLSTNISVIPNIGLWPFKITAFTYNARLFQKEKKVIKLI